MRWALEGNAQSRSATWGMLAAVALSTSAFLAAAPAEASTPVGAIFACYACQNTGDPVVDAALAANPGVAIDGLLFEFVNTSGAAITGATFSLSTGSYTDSYALGTIAANSSLIYMPGINDDGGSHPATSLFLHTNNPMDTSDGQGAVNDSSAFSLTGLEGLLAVTSGDFSPSGSYLPYRDNPSYQTSFVGQGPNGDGGCNNCYFGQIAVLSVPDVGRGGVPEPASWALMITGFGLAGAALRRRAVIAA